MFFNCRRRNVAALPFAGKEVRKMYEKEKKGKYRIEGRIDPKALSKVPKEMSLRVYAVRDRKIVGSCPVKKKGTFTVEYEWETYAKGRIKKPIGVYLMVGPDLPEDSILQHEFPKEFLESKVFKFADGTWHVKASDSLMQKLFSPNLMKKYYLPWWEIYCYDWRPCVQILACSQITGGLCYNERPMTDVRVRIHEIRFPLLVVAGQTPQTYTTIIAEGDTDAFGYFKASIRRCRALFRIPFHVVKGHRVEVGQVVDGLFHRIYMDPEDKPRQLESDLCQEIHILETDVIHPEHAEALLTGNTFRLTRIGNIPVGYINQDDTSAFHGYADSMAASDSATKKVKDCAFYGKIKIFANIGDGLLNTIKFYRIRYSYMSNGTTVENYVQVPFNNLRESTDAEKPIFGPYKTEFMGPTDGNIYEYPNPYDLAAGKQWVYKGLTMVLNTATLPLAYGKFTFTIEPLNAAKNPVTVDNPGDLSCTILVDNTPPSGSIGDIFGPSGVAAACGFLKLPAAGSHPGCDGNPRNRVSGLITVPFKAQDQNTNIHSITLQAHFGDVCDAPVMLVGPGMKPEISLSPSHSGCGGTVQYQNYDDVPQAERPHFGGSAAYCASLNHFWDVCAYEFRLTIHKRVTNGEVAHPWWTFSKHITITAS